jgi:hypothetical protein
MVNTGLILVEHLALVFMIMASGFVTGALVNYGSALVAGQDGGFRISFDNPFAIIVSFFVVMFVGPILTMQGAIKYLRLGSVSLKVFGAAFVICLLWSFCSGVLIVQLLALIGVIAV